MKLIPAIIQDNNTMQILMLGYMNQEAYQITKKTKKVTFYSRSRQKIWQKGETSGNCLKVIEIKKDCDKDTLLILAEPQGPTCHKNKYSCFNIPKTPKNGLFLNQLFALVKDRQKNMPKNSYTTSLLSKGLNEISKKLAEESIETILAAQNESKKRLSEESADLLYHLLVLLAIKNLDINTVIQELIKRQEN